MLMQKYKMVGRYLDNTEFEVEGESEADCLNKFFALIEIHGFPIWYSGVTDEHYIDGELRYGYE